MIRRNHILLDGISMAVTNRSEIVRNGMEFQTCKRENPKSSYLQMCKFMHTPKKSKYVCENEVHICKHLVHSFKPGVHIKIINFYNNIGPDKIVCMITQYWTKQQDPLNFRLTAGALPIGNRLRR